VLVHIVRIIKRKSFTTGGAAAEDDAPRQDGDTR
jgi:hypothetical protein